MIETKLSSKRKMKNMLFSCFTIFIFLPFPCTNITSVIISFKLYIDFSFGFVISGYPSIYILLFDIKLLIFLLFMIFSTVY